MKELLESFIEFKLKCMYGNDCDFWFFGICPWCLRESRFLFKFYSTDYSKTIRACCNCNEKVLSKSFNGDQEIQIKKYLEE